jgi:hypothetical protein
MTDDTLLALDLSAVCCKKLTVGFGGGNQSSNGGLLLLRHSGRKIGVGTWLAATMPDHRDPSRGEHEIFENERFYLRLSRRLRAHRRA